MAATSLPRPAEPDAPAAEPAPPRARRGRPTRERTKQLSRLILDAARQLFLENGFVGTSMDGVAAAARISKGTLYARFPSKDALFTAMIEDQIGDWSDRARQRDVDMPADLHGRLVHHVTVVLDSVCMPDLMQFGEMIMAERRRFPELARIYHQNGAMYEARLIAADLEAWAAREGRTLADPLGVAFSLIEAVLGWVGLRGIFESPDAEGRRRIAERIVALHMTGIDAW